MNSKCLLKKCLEFIYYNERKIMKISEINPLKLYHATDRKNLKSIMEHGLKNPYLSNDMTVTNYYAEEFKNSVILTVIINNTSNLIPDFNGIDEPLTYTLRKKEEDIWEEWKNSDKTWKDSLEIIHTVQYKGTIESKYIKLLD